MRDLKGRAPRRRKKEVNENTWEEAWEARFEEEKQRIARLPRDEGWDEGTKAFLWILRSFDLSEEKRRHDEEKKINKIKPKEEPGMHS